MVHNVIPWAQPFFVGKEKHYVSDALRSTWISGGAYVTTFEKEFVRYCHGQYGVSVSNGTTALQLALMALDIGFGDEVIVPGFSFVAPVNMVLERGAQPVYVDVDPLTWCIDPKEIKKRLHEKQKQLCAFISMAMYAR